MSWTKDDRTAEFLRFLGCDFLYEQQIDMALLSEGWNLNNPSRNGPAILDDAVAEYTERIANGENPPAVVVIFRPDGTVFPLDGRQRLSAAREVGWTHFNAYVLAEETSRRMIEMIEIGANLKTNGSAPVDRKFIYRRAAQYHLDHGVGVQQIAKDVGLTVSKLQEHLAYIRELQYLTARGVPAEPMPQNVVVALADLDREWWNKAPKETYELACVIAETGLQNGKVAQLVDDMNVDLKGKRSRSQLAQKHLLELKSDSWVAKKLAGGNVRSHDTKVVEQLKRMHTVCSKAVDAGTMLNVNQTRELVKFYAEVKQYIRQLVKPGTPL